MAFNSDNDVCYVSYPFGDRFWSDSGSIFVPIWVDFRLCFPSVSAFELAVGVVRDRLSGSIDLCAIGLLSAILRESLHQLGL